MGASSRRGVVRVLAAGLSAVLVFWALPARGNVTGGTGTASIRLNLAGLAIDGPLDANARLGSLLLEAGNQEVAKALVALEGVRAMSTSLLADRAEATGTDEKRGDFAKSAEADGASASLSVVEYFAKANQPSAESGLDALDADVAVQSLGVRVRLAEDGLRAVSTPQGSVASVSLIVDGLRLGLADLIPADLLGALPLGVLIDLVGSLGLALPADVQAALDALKQLPSALGDADEVSDDLEAAEDQLLVLLADDSAVTAAQAQMEAAEADLAAALAERNAASAAVEAAEAELAAAEADVTAAEAAVASAQSAVAAAQSSVSTLDAQVASLEAQIATLEAQLAALDPLNPLHLLEIAELTAQLTTLESQLVSAQSSLAAAESGLAAAQALLAAAQADLTAAEGRLAQAQADLAAAQQRLSDAETAVADASAALAAAQAALQAAVDAAASSPEIDALKAQIAALQAELDRLVGLLTALLGDIPDLQELITDLRALLAGAPLLDLGAVQLSLLGETGANRAFASVACTVPDVRVLGRPAAAVTCAELTSVLNTLGTAIRGAMSSIGLNVPVVVDAGRVVTSAVPGASTSTSAVDLKVLDLSVGAVDVGELVDSLVGGLDIALADLLGGATIASAGSAFAQSLPSSLQTVLADFQQQVTALPTRIIPSGLRTVGVDLDVATLSLGTLFQASHSAGPGDPGANPSEPGNGPGTPGDPSTGPGTPTDGAPSGGDPGDGAPGGPSGELPRTGGGLILAALGLWFAVTGRLLVTTSRHVGVRAPS